MEGATPPDGGATGRFASSLEAGKNSKNETARFASETSGFATLVVRR